MIDCNAFIVSFLSHRHGRHGNIEGELCRSMKELHLNLSIIASDHMWTIILRGYLFSGFIIIYAITHT